MTMPAWVEKFVIAARRKYLKPEDCRAAFLEYRDAAIAALKEKAKESPTTIDDKILKGVEEALAKCGTGADADMVCKLLADGKAQLVEILMKAAADTETMLDDEGARIVAEALGVALPAAKPA
jgi:ABC-type cobalamin/Fe3+-siderophores transport system ATPase subunit